MSEEQTDWVDAGAQPAQQSDALAMNEKLQLLQEWSVLRDQVATFKPIIDRELKLRKELAKIWFNFPQEGTNSAPLPAGYTLKAVLGYDRKIDPEALKALAPELEELGVHKDNLLEYKPSLKISAYRELTAAQRQVFDQALVVTDKSPQLSIVAPKK